MAPCLFLKVMTTSKIEAYLLVKYIKTGQISRVVVFQVCVSMLAFESYDYVYNETKKIQGLFARPAKLRDITYLMTTREK